MNIWIAAADNDLYNISQAIERGGASPNDKDENGYTALHAAASYGHVDLLKYLVEKGGDVNIQDNDGDTPLHACESVIVARALISMGADPQVKNSEDQTPLDKAVEEQEFPELINYFMTLAGGSKTDENVEFKVNFQQESDTTLPGERSLNPDQREELASIINNGTDADLEAFLQKAMAENPQPEDAQSSSSPSGKRAKR